MAYITEEMLEDFSGKYPSDEPYYLPETGLTAWNPDVEYFTKTASGYVAVDQSTETFDENETYYTAHTAVERYVQAAMEKVREYLGYDPELHEYEENVRAAGTQALRLSAPVEDLKGISCNGVELTLNGWESAKNYIVRYEGNNSVTFPKGALYSVRYSGGFSQVPQMIVQTALQIGDLMWERAGGTLAVSSTSFADTGTRVFNNFKMDRFLEQINGYRIYGG